MTKHLLPAHDLMTINPMTQWPIDQWPINSMNERPIWPMTYWPMTKSVKRICYLLPLLILVCISCSSFKKSTYTPAQKFSAEQLQSDFSLLQKILQSNHPSLYWYTPKDSVDYYFKASQSTLKDSLTELQFKNRIGWAISKIRCGHTVACS